MDKLYHAVGCFGITLGAYALLWWTPDRLVYATIIALAVGFGKEIWDMMGHGDADIFDIFADLTGIVAALWVVS